MSKHQAKLLFFVIGWTISVYGCMENCRNSHYCALLSEAVSQISLDNVAMRDIFCEKNINDQDCKGNTLLHYCVWHKNITVDFIDYLLKRGARFDIKNNDGHSVMFYHRMMSMSPVQTPEEGLIEAQSVPKREVMDFLFATEVVARLDRVDWQRNMQERQKFWLAVTYFR